MSAMDVYSSDNSLGIQFQKPKDFKNENNEEKIKINEENKENNNPNSINIIEDNKNNINVINEQEKKN